MYQQSELPLPNPPKKKGKKGVANHPTLNSVELLILTSDSNSSKGVFPETAPRQARAVTSARQDTRRLAKVTLMSVGAELV